ncbi:MAG: hypothetical protein H6537_02310 [Bacteroidales bacterium]|nr:hypothetical protein [Bacteroidales bacterium]HPD94326.1 hypothetical protein [Tenuifilaceae bacterium]HRX31593.1 hypothetical protein [Tenuifilaceae bacterium]
MNKVTFILELIWLGLAIACLGLGIHSTLKFGFSISYMFYILAVVAFLMYLLRRYRRKKIENQNNK